VNGIGYLTLSEALERARETESGPDPALLHRLQNELVAIWQKLQRQPNSYLLSRDEYALFNYFRQDTLDNETARKAVQRFWDHDSSPLGLLRREKAWSALKGCLFMHARTYLRNADGLAVLEDTRSLRQPDPPISLLRLARNSIVSESAHDDRLPRRPCDDGRALLLARRLCARDTVDPRTVRNGPLSQWSCPRMTCIPTSTSAPSFQRAASCGTLAPPISRTLLWLAALIFALQLNPMVSAQPDAVRQLPNLISGRADAAKTAANATALLEDLEVDPPVYTPSVPDCQEVLMVHVFAYSYGEPYVGDYEPPSCDFNRVVFNFTVTSAGRQYDRLGLMYFNDTEIFRTSTAEPTTDGIEWTYIKDMSAYLSLFKEPQKIIFDLGNLITDVYTGTFNTTLTASFYNEDVEFVPADVIIPISARKSVNDSASAFSFPDDNATNTVTLPQNVERATFSISACGQSAEEFWWSNVLSSDTDTFGDSSFYGYSPFREVQLYIDDTLAGVAWPFPVIFTGGVVPGFWRPIVGIDAFDLKEDQIDITPFLGLLCDGSPHTFTIRVSGINDTASAHTGVLSETVNSYWVVTGKIFLWLSQPGSVTTGTAPSISAPPPSISLSSTPSALPNGTNSSLIYAVSVTRDLSISAHITTANNTTTLATWTQSLTYSNEGNITQEGYAQSNTQSTKAHDTSSSGYFRTLSYPLYVYDYYILTDNSTYIASNMDRGKDVKVVGGSAFPLGIEGSSAADAEGSHLETRQNGTASYYAVTSPSSSSTSSGSTEQDLKFSAVDDGTAGVQGEGYGEELLYKEHILAVDGEVVSDVVVDEGEEVQRSWRGTEGQQQAWGVKGVRGMLGRGP
ncbi:hypothetical protein K490DRAFT_21031, partial [Saccharata proteae CBS 121410]